MFRFLATKRVLMVFNSNCRTSSNNLEKNLHSFRILFTSIVSSRFSTDSNPNNNPFANQNPSPLHQSPEALGDQEHPTLNASTSASAPENEFRHRDYGSDRRGREPRSASPSSEYQEEQARVLQAALSHVNRLGWSETAMIAGAKDVGVSPSIVGSFPRKEASLVEYFMDVCLQRLIERIDSDEELENLIQSERITKLVRIRLEMQAPYISRWPQALSIQTQPMNIPTSFKQRAMLVDEIWHAAGDQASDIDWYAKRTALGGIYSATEIYMLTDKSPDFHDTWTFLDHRVKDAFDIGKTVQEAKDLAEAVGEGIGSTLRGMMSSVGRGR